MEFAVGDMVKELKEDGVARLQALVYNYLMRSLLTAIRALDLGYRAQTDANSLQQAEEGSLSARHVHESDESEVLAIEMGSGLVANNVLDMQAFFNLAGECNLSAWTKTASEGMAKRTVHTCVSDMANESI